MHGAVFGLQILHVNLLVGVEHLAVVPTDSRAGNGDLCLVAPPNRYCGSLIKLYPVALQFGTLFDFGLQDSIWRSYLVHFDEGVPSPQMDKADGDFRLAQVTEQRLVLVLVAVYSFDGPDAFLQPLFQAFEVSLFYGSFAFAQVDQWVVFLFLPLKANSAFLSVSFRQCILKAVCFLFKDDFLEFKFNFAHSELFPHFKDLTLTFRKHFPKGVICLLVEGLKDHGEVIGQADFEKGCQFCRCLGQLCGILQVVVLAFAKVGWKRDWEIIGQTGRELCLREDAEFAE